MKEIKEGDKVRIKSLSWYNKFKEEDGSIHFHFAPCFVSSMKKYCGKIVTIKKIEKDRFFTIEDFDRDDYRWRFSFFCIDKIVKEEKQLEFNF